MVVNQHGDALRALLDMDLGVSGVAMLSLQYEAVLRAVWTLWVATEPDLNKLSAPLTPATTKAANSLGMANELLKAIGHTGSSRPTSSSEHYYHATYSSEMTPCGAQSLNASGRSIETPNARPRCSSVPGAGRL